MCSDLGLLRSTKYYTYGRNTLMWSTLVFQTTHSKQWRYSGGTVYVQCGYYCYGSVKTGSHGCGNHSSQTRLLFGSESVMSFLLGPRNTLLRYQSTLVIHREDISRQSCKKVICVHWHWCRKHATYWICRFPPCLGTFNRAERQWPLRFLSQHRIEQRPLSQWKDILSLAGAQTPHIQSGKSQLLNSCIGLQTTLKVFLTNTAHSKVGKKTLSCGYGKVFWSTWTTFKYFRQAQQGKIHSLLVFRQREQDFGVFSSNTALKYSIFNRW